LSPLVLRAKSVRATNKIKEGKQTDVKSALKFQLRLVHWVTIHFLATIVFKAFFLLTLMLTESLLVRTYMAYMFVRTVRVFVVFMIADMVKEV
jgi:Ni,Fe-hydrogenase I cytochrome b subunit